jgi:hypothetical protein
MKKAIWITIVLFLSLVSIDAYAQVNFNITPINHFRGYWKDGVWGAKVRGNYAFLACASEGLHICDISNPTHITDAGHFEAIKTNTITIRGNLAYTGCDDEGFFDILDISDATHPEELSRVSLSGYHIWDIEVEGDYAYLASYSGGFTIIDIADSLAPTVVWNSSDIIEAFCIDIEGNLAYVTCSGNVGLRTYDISNPANPVLIDQYYSHDGIYINAAIVRGNYGFLALSKMGFRIIDLSTRQILFQRTDLEDVFQIQIVDNHFYLNCPGQMIVYDISDLAVPIQIGTFPLMDACTDFCISNNLMIIATVRHGLRIVDWSDINSPIEISNLNRYGHPNEVKVVGDIAYVKDGYRLAAVDINDPLNPGELSYYEFNSNDIDITWKDTIAFVLMNGTFMLYAIKYNDPENPELLSSHQLRIYINRYKTAIGGNYLYISEEFGIHILDISDPCNIQEAGYLEMITYSGKIAVLGHYLFFDRLFHGIEVYDLVDPVHPQFIGRYNLNSYCADLTVSDNILYALSNHYLYLYETGSFQNWQPLSVTLIDTAGTAGFAHIEEQNRTVFISGAQSGLAAYDASDPAHIHLNGQVNPEGIANGFDFKGSTAVVAEYDNLGFYDCSLALGIEESNPTVPSKFELLQNYPNPFNGSTMIQFDNPINQRVTLAAYDILGRKVTTIADREFNSGRHSIIWNGLADSGHNLASGRYYIMAKAGDRSQSLPVLLLK